jgi:phage protein D
VSVSVPSLQLLGPTYELQVSGTGTDYDQTYAITKITYEIETENGAKTSIEAKFSSPVSLYDDETGVAVGEQA